MSEREPTPEKRLPRLFDNCNNCEQDYDLEPNNAKLYMYDAEPDCNYLYCTCTHCQSNFIMFVGMDTVLNAIRHGIDPRAEKYAPDKIKNARLKLLGIELIEPVEITARHEKLIGSFAATLANCPDDLLYDFITDENNNRDLPQRWA